MGLGKGGLKVKRPSHHTVKVYVITLITALTMLIGLDQLLARLLLGSPPPPTLLQVGGGPCAQPTLRAWGGSSGGGLHTLFGILHRFICSLQFIYSFNIYLYKYNFMGVYFMLWVKIQHLCYLFCLSACSSFGHWVLLQLAPVSLVHPTAIVHLLQWRGTGAETRAQQPRGSLLSTGVLSKFWAAGVTTTPLCPPRKLCQPDTCVYTLSGVRSLDTVCSTYGTFLISLSFF